MKEIMYEGTIVPYWCFESIVMLFLLFVYIAVVVLAVRESVVWFIEVYRKKAVRRMWRYITAFLLLLIFSLHRGYMYIYANACWVITLLKIPEVPSYEVLEYGSIIQESIVLDLIRLVGHILLYLYASLLIRKHRKTIHDASL